MAKQCFKNKKYSYITKEWFVTFNFELIALRLKIPEPVKLLKDKLNLRIRG